MKMTSGKIMIPVAILYALYFVSLLSENDQAGDFLSPVLCFICFIPVLYGYGRRESRKGLKYAGYLLAAALLAWGICDLFWALIRHVLHLDPSFYDTLENVYSLSNILILASLLISFYREMRKINKMQVLLDSMMVTISIAALIWVFVFQRNLARAAVLETNWIAMLSLLTDVMIIAWSFIWYFSVRSPRSPLCHYLNFIGEVLFAVTDIIYYYVYFYKTYVPNSLIDGGYTVSFAIIALSGVMKINGCTKMIPNIGQIRNGSRIWIRKEVFFLVIPVIIFAVEGSQSRILLGLVCVIMFYFLFTNYIQENIYRDMLLAKEKNHVAELEARVEERTAQIYKAMTSDVVTGMHNRLYLEQKLAKMSAELKPQEKIFILYVDLNKYKSLKSIYGKYTAEHILKECGGRIEQIMTQSGGFAASYGDDEFIGVLLTEDGKDDGIQQAARNIISYCSDTYHVEQKALVVTMNVGIACYPDDTGSQEELIRDAEMAMLQSRKTGFNTVFRYDSRTGENMKKQELLGLQLKKVDYKKDFYLLYQPQVRCCDGVMIGVEALLRWKAPDGAVISPLDFIPLAEENGMIIPLGYWIMETAARQLAEWKNCGMSGIRMAVNVSSKQLLDERFADILDEILTRYEIHEGEFEIEITESVQLENNTELNRMLQEIRERGVSIAMDDFGTGYSSLHYLTRMPISRIKIAKELVDRIETDVYSRSVVQMMASVAQVNQISVIAEGVETQPQWEALMEFNCDEIQGFFFARPLAPDAVARMYQESRDRR